MYNLVSVIIPTYGGGDQLHRAIDSVLNQSYRNIEVIIVDDNNPNTKERLETSNIIKKYNDERIKYIQHSKNKNGAAARNTGLKNSRGEYITFLDDDDFLFPTRIEDSVIFLEENQEYKAMYCTVALCNKENILKFISANKVIDYKDILLDEMIVGTGSNIFIKRDIVEKVEGFDESFKRHQDLEFLIRVTGESKIINLNKLLIVKAVNKTNNLPNYKQFREIKLKYFEKFKENLELLNEDELNIVLNYHYTILFNLALQSNNLCYIEQAVKELVQVRKLTYMDKISIYIYKHKINKLKLYNVLFECGRRIKKGILNRKIKQYENIKLDDIKFIKDRL